MKLTYLKECKIHKVLFHIILSPFSCGMDTFKAFKPFSQYLSGAIFKSTPQQAHDLQCYQWQPTRQEFHKFDGTSSDSNWDFKCYSSRFRHLKQMKYHFRFFFYFSSSLPHLILEFFRPSFTWAINMQLTNIQLKWRNV